MLAFKAIIFAASGAIATWLTAFTTDPGDHLYFLMARGSGKCLQQSGATLNNGDAVAQWTCTNRANFKLRKIEHGDGSFYLQFAHSGKCVKPADGLLEDILLGAARPSGAALLQWDCSDRADARWRSRAASDGYVFLISEQSGKCLSLDDGAKEDGNAITQWECARRPDMMWKLVPAK
jgi:hypothetical protein